MAPIRPQLLQAVHAASAADPKALMLVGHNPGMHELALMLAGSGDDAGRKALGGQSADLGAGDLRIFEVDDWDDVAFRRGRLAKFVSPKLLKQTSGD